MTEETDGGRVDRTVGRDEQSALIAELMDSVTLSTDREYAARAEIKRLREALAWISQRAAGAHPHDFGAALAQIHGRACTR
jgi:hypothetical protein